MIMPVLTAQMEKTVHWSSDCTANWRQSTQGPYKMDELIKEATEYKREKQELVNKMKTITQIIGKLERNYWPCCQSLKLGQTTKSTLHSILLATQ